MRYAPTTADTPDLVRSVVSDYVYDGSTTATVDAELALLATDFIGARSNLAPARKAAFRRDVDRLLERRLWLRMSEAA